MRRRTIHEINAKRTEECGARPLHRAAGRCRRRGADHRPGLRRRELEHARRWRRAIIADHPRRPARCAQVQVRAAAGARRRRRHVAGAVEEGHTRQAGGERKARRHVIGIASVDAAAACGHHAQGGVRAQQRRQQSGIDPRSLQRRGGVGGASRREHARCTGAGGVRSSSAASERPRDDGVRPEQRCGCVLHARRLVRLQPTQLGRHAAAACAEQVAARRAGRCGQRGVDGGRLRRCARVAVQQRSPPSQLPRRAAHQRQRLHLPAQRHGGHVTALRWEARQ